MGTPSRAATLYVDGTLTADCSSNGYSIAERACRGADGPGYSTFASAMAAMEPGDTMAIRGGTYRRSLIVTKNGTAPAHLRFAAHAGERVVIDLAGVGGTASGIEAISKHFLDFDGLTILNAPFMGFRGISSTYISITNSEFGYSYHSGIAFEAGGNVSVTRSRIHHSHLTGGTGHEAVTFRNVNGFSITDSEVYENGKEGIDAKYGSRNGVIARNNVYRSKSANIYIDGATSIQIVGNLCHDNQPHPSGGITRAACIGLGMEITAGVAYPTHDITIHNNVMYGSGAGVFMWPETADWGVFERIRIEYNTIVDMDHAGIWILNHYGNPLNFGSGITIRNNIIMGQANKAIRDAEEAPVVHRFTVDHNVFKSGEFSATFGTNAVMATTSPFVNRAGRDLHLVAGSPALNAGVSIPDISTDIEGRLRPSGATDAGAYQFGSGTTEVPPPAPTLPPRAATGVRVVQ